MNEKDIKNIETIISLVENYFSLSKKSLDFFKKEMYKTTLDTFFEEIFKKHKVEDMRLRFKIPRDICKTLDNGWKVFCDVFPSFIQRYKFSYDNFVDNKLLIEKNSIKSRKALISFYTDINNFTPFRRDIASSIPIPGISSIQDWEQKKGVSEAIIKEITNYIDKNLDSISQKCLPKTDIQLVLSCNFADWFLCSTAESWKSCLNLESEFHAAYWSGLPGLIGDKSRCMLYITDGNKKTYKGINVDKIIARSWGILSGKNILHIVKPYPLADIFDANTVSSITGFEVQDLGGSMGFTSKSAIKFMHFNDEREPTCFIYQDGTSFGETGHIKRSSGGFYSFINGNLTRGEPIFRFTDGLSSLIESKNSIERYMIKKMSCQICNRDTEDTTRYLIDGEEIIICQHCLKERFFKCSLCKEYHRRENKVDIQLENGETKSVCSNCLKKKCVMCDICNTYHLKKETYNIYDERKHKSKICLSCVKDVPEAISCQNCGDYMPQEMLLQADLLGRDYRCEHCLQASSDKKQIFFDFIKTKETFSSLEEVLERARVNIEVNIQRGEPEPGLAF